jgi:hypothetical protein
VTLTAGATTERAARRLVIVLAYPDGSLANAWFRAYKRVKRGVRTKGLNVRVELRPSTDLPPETDVLVVPAGANAEGWLAGARHVLTSAPESVQADVDFLISTMLADGRLDYAPAASRRSAIHRGALPVDGRARSLDD